MPDVDAPCSGIKLTADEAYPENYLPGVFIYRELFEHAIAFRLTPGEILIWSLSTRGTRGRYHTDDKTLEWIAFLLRCPVVEVAATLASIRTKVGGHCGRWCNA